MTSFNNPRTDKSVPADYPATAIERARLDNIRITVTKNYRTYGSGVWLMYFRYIILNDNKGMMRVRIPLWRFFEYVKWWYQRKIKEWKKITITVRNVESGELFSFVPFWRFTDEYKNRVMFKFYSTLGRKIHYWITLTTTAYSGQDIYEYAEGFKKNLAGLWRRFYLYQKKWDKDIEFVRVYEITKKNTLHVHCAVFTKLTDSVLKQNIVIQNEKFGFVKIFKYTAHEMKTFVSPKGKEYQTFVSRSHESWFDDGVVRWKYKGVQRSSNKLMNYLLKYMNKDSPEIHRALFTFFKVRTYSISRNFKSPMLTRPSSDNFEFDHLSVNFEQTL